MRIVKKILSIIVLGVILFFSSCTFPHWIVPQRHVIVDAIVGNAPEVVQVTETRISKSHFNIEQFFRSKTLNISEKSFSVLYQGKQIQPKVWAFVSNENRKHKGTGTLCTRLKKRSFVHFFAEIFGGNGKNTYICTMKLKFNDIYGTQSKTNKWYWHLSCDA